MVEQEGQNTQQDQTRIHRPQRRIAFEKDKVTYMKKAIMKQEKESCFQLGFPGRLDRLVIDFKILG